MAEMRDEYGNPVQETTGGPGMQGHGGGAPEMGIGAAGGGGQGVLHRSGSSSSSSSEDDGQGGRRKKGLKEKIKEKLPGGQKTTEPGHTTGGVYEGGHQVGQTGYEGGHQPGHTTGGLNEGGHQPGHTTGGLYEGGHQVDQTGYEGGHQPGHTTGGVYEGGHQVGQEHEKKGMMEKIKEKLPGLH